MIPRPIYLNRIIPSLGTPVVKVITGMRRVGKSSILRQLVTHLRAQKVRQSHIALIDLEDLGFDQLRDYKKLTTYIEQYFHGVTGKKYLLIDEIQDITEWERTIRHYAKSTEYEIFITGSNSHLLSSELSTYLAGRYLEFPVYPLTFREFKEFLPKGNFALYREIGGLPGAVLLPTEFRKEYLEGVLHTVLFRDIIDRYNIRNGSLLTDILRFVAANIGYPTSTKKIADYLKKERITLAFETVREYLEYCRKAFFIQVPSWQDINGKQHLDLNAKYYFTDIGIRNALVGYKDEHIGQILENIVYNELLVRGYKVTIGRVGNREVDFVAEKPGKRMYLQVAYLLASLETVEREFAPLEKIQDNYQKIVLSLDTDWGAGRNGIERKELTDWLLGETF